MSKSASTSKTAPSCAPAHPFSHDGTFDLVVKIYFPDEDQPGGTLSNILDCMREGEEIEVKGPSGAIRGLGNGKLAIDDNEYTFDKVYFILGGSGVTPGYQVTARIPSTSSDKTLTTKAIYANKSSQIYSCARAWLSLPKTIKTSFLLRMCFRIRVMSGRD
ncbi:uncharacterized protein DSM5745_01868 [Aspergillus mulundensis]|uniref:Flavoprotein pyridine nucleotide cytochrome reductase-like FAD-binding domain-containing protein n=1 Tax=Aspergillus mulundensis TaxID=1810919 RepID=A0A3D8SUU4_9EURO|nr:hypothetical protein DSM5745_01868 [Aspergillus mulundensis]RDW90093.1 hypothetical protein DSM5745_01868 [Aspergillus mulundensis]